MQIIYFSKAKDIQDVLILQSRFALAGFKSLRPRAATSRQRSIAAG